MEIKSIDILDFKFSLKKYIQEHPFPTELKRMLVNEILIELNQQANDEVIAQAEERENKSKEEKSDVALDEIDKRSIKEVNQDAESISG